MSRLRRTLIVLLPLALLAFGCSKKNENVLLHPSEGHTEGWLTEHGGASQQSDCSECHGDTTADGTSIDDVTLHVNGTADISLRSGITWSGSSCDGTCHDHEHEREGWN